MLRSETITEMYSCDSTPFFVTGSKAVSPTSGSFSLPVLGDQFGSYSCTQKIRMGKSGAERSVWSSSTYIMTRTPAGTYGSLGISLSIELLVSSQSSIASYQPPALSSSRPRNVPSSGSISLSVLGQNMGTRSTSLSLRSFRTSAMATKWIADSSLAARNAKGLEVSIKLTSSVSCMIGSRTKFITFDGPTIKHVSSPRNFDPSVIAASSVTVLGANFGYFHQTPASKTASSSNLATYWISDSALYSKISNGVSFTEEYMVTVAVSRFGTLTEVMSFDSPSLNSTTPPNSPTSGGKSLTIRGRNFGARDYSCKARVAGDTNSRQTSINGGTAFEATRWLSASILACKSPRGLFSNYPIALSLSSRTSTISQSLTFDMPTIFASIFPNGPSAGGSTSLVLGSNLGWIDTSLSARIGSTSCYTTQWLSGSSVTCLIPLGDGIMRDIAITLFRMKATLSMAFSYNTIVLDFAQPQTSNIPANITTSLTALGKNFGNDPILAGSPNLRVGGTSCVSTNWISDSSLACFASSGFGASQSITLTNRGRTSTVSNSITFDIPNVVEIVPILNVSTPYFIAIRSFALFTTLSAAISGTSTRSSEWMSESSVLCLSGSGLGMSKSVVITASMQPQSLSDVYTYSSHYVSSGDPGNGPKIGLTKLTLYGSSFGTADRSASIRILSSPTDDLYVAYGTSSSTSWLSDSSLLALTCRGLSSKASVSVSLAVRVNTLSVAYSYDSFADFTLSRPNSPLSGGVRTTVIGQNFGWLDLTPTLTIGDSACEGTSWLSDSSIQCTILHGTKTFTSFNNSTAELLILAINNRTQTNPLYRLTYDSPSLYSIAGTNLHSKGQSPISVFGSNFGLITDLSVQARVGFTSAESSEWVSDTAIIAKSASGVSGLLSVEVTVAGTFNTISEAVTYARPWINYISPVFDVPDGGETVNITGQSFGVSDYTPTVFVDFNPCLSSIWTSDSAISCTVPKGYGPGQGVAVAVGDEFGTPSIVFEYQYQNILNQGDVPFANHAFLALWLRADSLLSLVDAYPLDRGDFNWSDARNIGLSALVVNGPEILKRQINDLPVVRLSANRSNGIKFPVSLHSIFGPGALVNRQFCIFFVLRISSLDGRMNFLFAGNERESSFFSFSVLPVDGIYEHVMRIMIDSNLVQKQDRNMTAERRYSIFVLAHDGFEMKTYKGSSLNPIRLVHNLDGTEGVFPFSSILNGKTISSDVPPINQVSIGCREQGNNTAGCMNADIAEILVYDTMLITEDLDRVAGYLSRKYVLDWQFSTGPSILSISPTNGPTTGGSYVTISGAAFGTQEANILVTFAQKNATLIGFSTYEKVVNYNTQIIVTSPPGVGFVPIRISVFGVPTFLNNAWRYDAPEILKLEPSTAQASGGIFVSLIGNNFGQLHDNAVVVVESKKGRKECEQTVYISNTMLLCKVPSSTFESSKVIIAVGQQKSNPSDLLYYGIPSIFDCWPQKLDCMDCCEQRCTWEQVREQTANGLTSYECRKKCSFHCSTVKVKASEPLNVLVKLNTLESSGFLIAWEPPLDDGGSTILYYSISYVINGSELIGRTVAQETSFQFRGLPSETTVDNILVRAVTKFGFGSPSNPPASAKTLYATPPSQPIAFRVDNHNCYSIQISWDLPIDLGGRQLDGYVLKWSVRGKLSSATLGSDNKTFTIERVNSPTIDLISLSSVNNVGSSEPSVIRNLSLPCSSFPVISDINNVVVGAGEVSEEFPFTVEDLETSPMYLKVFAKSLNESYLSSSHIIIGGLGKDRTVKILCDRGWDGVVVVKVSVIDEDGMYSFTLFQVRIRQSVFCILPSEGFAQGGSLITVLGAGFSVASSYTCSFKCDPVTRCTSSATFQSPYEIVCVVPPWQGSGMTSGVDVYVDGALAKPSSFATSIHSLQACSQASTLPAVTSTSHALPPGFDDVPIRRGLGQRVLQQLTERPRCDRKRL
eukprot:210360-Hanusia_phi.AAC.2